MNVIHAAEVFLVDLVDKERRAAWLGFKKTEPLRGKLLGFGGKCEKGETPVACAIRETFEESGCTIANADLRSIGIMHTYRPFGQFIVHLYIAERWTGTPHETEEMRPVRVSLDGAFPIRTPLEVRMILSAIADGNSDMRITVNEDANGCSVDMTYRRTR
jgi:8-oxo-dGTP pyrophosphatase MutT (NUDIX family)